jgi:hypothetical protein
VQQVFGGHALQQHGGGRLVVDVVGSHDELIRDIVRTAT